MSENIDTESNFILVLNPSAASTDDEEGNLHSLFTEEWNSIYAHSRPLEFPIEYYAAVATEIKNNVIFKVVLPIVKKFLWPYKRNDLSS